MLEDDLGMTSGDSSPDRTVAHGDTVEYPAEYKCNVYHFGTYRQRNSIRTLIADCQHRVQDEIAAGKRIHLAHAGIPHEKRHH